MQVVPMTKSPVKAASIRDFALLLHKILTAAWGDSWGVFVRSFPKQSEARDVRAPRITWHIEAEAPSEDHGRKEIKPRFREELDETKDNQKVNIWAQKLDVVMTFRVYCYSDTEADQMVERFKDLMQIYTGFFKQNGVQEIIYLGQAADEAFGSQKTFEEMTCRPVKYLIRIERITLETQSVIETIVAKVRTMNEFTGEISEDSFDATIQNVNANPTISEDN